MNNTRQRLGIFIIFIALIILGVIIYVSFFNKSPETVVVPDEQIVTGQLPVEEEINRTTPGDKPRDYVQYNISQEVEHKTNENDLSKLAMSFSERLGSYSNQSNYNNFTDLKIFMTDSMKSWADRYVEELRDEPNVSNSYFGISTKALIADVEYFNNEEGTAEIMVTTQRQESTSNISDSKTYTQEITISFLMVNGEWLVDKAYWQ